MIKVELNEIAGFRSAVMGMRNPMNSWDKSDSYETHIEDVETLETAPFEFFLGDNDLKLMQNLTNAGVEHRTFARMIQVWITIDAPLYWWKEMDRYTVGKTQVSCSTMHKIHTKPFELSDFSMDDFYIDDYGIDLKDMFIGVVADCECLRKRFLTAVENSKKKDHFTEAEQKHFSRQAKQFWKGLIQLLPSSYNQKRTINMNYEVCMKIWKERHNHKLDEWKTLCDFILDLPYMKDIMKVDADE